MTYFGELANHPFVPDLEVHCELLPTLAGINFGEPGPMRGCTMKRSWGFSLAAMLCTVASIAGLSRSIAGSNDIDLTQWTPRES